METSAAPASGAKNVNHTERSPPPQLAAGSDASVVAKLVSCSSLPNRNVAPSQASLNGVVASPGRKIQSTWAGAGVGPPDVDVGHCRLNLTLLFSADAAERFRELYEGTSGRTVDPYWDVHALLSYGPDWKHFLPQQIDGRAPFDGKGMTRRMEEVLTLALGRA